MPKRVWFVILIVMLACGGYVAAKTCSVGCPTVGGCNKTCTATCSGTSCIVACWDCECYVDCTGSGGPGGGATHLQESLSLEMDSAPVTDLASLIESVTTFDVVVCSSLSSTTMTGEWGPDVAEDVIIDALADYTLTWTYLGAGQYEICD